MSMKVPEGEAAGATLSEIGALADVSISTVSKVLNGRPGVSDETRARIEVLLQQQGYSRRQPATGPAPLVEVLVWEIDSTWAVELIAGVERIAREHGLGMVVSNTQDRNEPDPRWMDGVLARRPVGVLLVGAQLPESQQRRLQSRQIPVVAIDQGGRTGRVEHSVGSADWSGAYAATSHLLELGHRRIAIITGPDDMIASVARVSGFRAALDAAGVPLPDEYVRHGEFHRQDGLEHGSVLLGLAEPPTAVFASNDLQALGVYEAARALDVRIPEQLSVVGYDDLKAAGWVVPALTTIRVPLAEMAEQATRLLVRLRDEPGFAVSHIDLATSLVVRQSTAPPADDSAG
jgi:LacI family transcriptional regulator, xylobiose transport system transcriptional regulator